MNSQSLSRLSGWCCVGGGSALVAVTLLHASLPEGCIGDDCLTHEMRGTAAGEGPLALVSTLLLSVAAVTLVVLARRRRPLGKVGAAALVCAAGALALVVAVTVVMAAVDGDVPWMPLLVIPALALFVAAAVLVGVTVLRARLVPTWLAVAVIATGSLLVLANEQTALVLLAVPFGTVCVLLGVNLLLRHGRAGSSEQPRWGTDAVAR
jgi:hypothetical protein